MQQSFQILYTRVHKLWLHFLDADNSYVKKLTL